MKFKFVIKQPIKNPAQNHLYRRCMIFWRIFPIGRQLDYPVSIFSLKIKISKIRSHFFLLRILTPCEHDWILPYTTKKPIFFDAKEITIFCIINPPDIQRTHGIFFICLPHLLTWDYTSVVNPLRLQFLFFFTHPQTPQFRWTGFGSQSNNKDQKMPIKSNLKSDPNIRRISGRVFGPDQSSITLGRFWS